jgi:mRNA interferase RelE/StbE
MNYTVVITRGAQRDLAALQPTTYRRVRDAIRILDTNPRPSGCSKLTDREAWKIRVGDYRVIYEIDDQQRQVTVRLIRHRREAYR